METVSKKKLSKCVSQELDKIGFDRRRIRERIHANNRCSKAKDISTKQILRTDDIEKIFVGSQREGIGFRYFNDLDILQINHQITCVKDRRNIRTDRKLVFQMIQKQAPAGYTFLKLLNKDTDADRLANIKYSLVKKKGGKFLSSKLFMTKNDDIFTQGNGLISQNTRYRPPRGPSIPKFIKNDLLKRYLSQMNLKEDDMDFVRAFPCNAEWCLKAWSERKRGHWPSRKLINHVMTLPSYVVPVGQKSTINDDLQWRISFTIAETYLIQAFNNIQTKVLVMMKLIAKYVLQPLCKDISSYVVKTITLWMAEKIPQKKFRQKHLVARLKDALTYLKTAVENKYLPSYMIPKRNLFMNKLRKQQQKVVLLKINFLMQNGLELIYDNFCNKGTHSKEILSVRDAIFRANLLDKFETCKLALYTIQQLADYNFNMFYISARWQVVVHHILFQIIPYIFTYGICGLTDPLSIDLSKEFAKRAKEEQVILGQDTSSENQHSIQHSSTAIVTEFHLNMSQTTPFNVLFPMLYLLFIVLYQLFKHGVIFMT